jgi:2-polyprenyl-3-methyl-5-hydroxy-6-metoxy-1,4-benzoquinol methylase
MSLDPAAERERLDRVAVNSTYAEGANGAMIAYLARVFDRHWRGRRCLELGPAEGLLTDRLSRRFEELVLVDGSTRFCTELRERFPSAEVVCSLFEEYQPTRRFDAIVLGHVLEHVEDPTALLRRAHDWLEPGGRVYAAVPNARSVHRQAAVIMGLLEQEHALNETDRSLGHRRVYDPEALRAEFLRAGFTVDVFGGFWLKPLSIAQLDAQWTAEQLEAYMQVGERYPDIAAEIYVIASPR